MKKNACFLLFQGFVVSISAQNYLLSKNENAFYSIVVDKQADSLTIYAAEELQDFLYKITGARFKISNKSSVRGKSIFIGRDWFAASPQSAKLKAVGEDGYGIFNESGHFYLGGNRPVGDLYAVYALPQDYAGCVWLGNGDVYVPSEPALSLPELKIYAKPDFSFRHPHFPDRNKLEYYFPTRTQPMNQWGMFVHTFQHLMPPDKYFDAHPEYFSMVNGKRIRDGQLCLSNPEVISLLKENLAAEIAKKPGHKVGFSKRLYKLL